MKLFNTKTIMILTIVLILGSGCQVIQEADWCWLFAKKSVNKNRNTDNELMVTEVIEAPEERCEIIAYYEEDAVTDQELLKFCQEIAIAINNRNHHFFNQYFDLAGIVNNITNSIDAPVYFEQNFQENIIQNKSIDVGKEIIAAIEENGTYTFLKILQFNNKQVALFKVSNQQTFSYHELSMVKKEETYLINDFFIYDGGLPFSSVLKRIFLSMLHNEIIIDEQKVLAEVLCNAQIEDKVFVEYADKIDKLSVYMHEEQYGNALRLIECFPPILQQDDMVLLLYLNIAQNIKGEVLDEAISTFKQHHTCAYMLNYLLLQSAIDNRNSQKIIMYSMDIQGKIGTDNGLQLLIAKEYDKQNKRPEAEAILMSVISSNTAYLPAYQQLTAMYLAESDYSAAVELLDLAHRKNQTDPKEIIAYTDFKDFWHSATYKQWENSKKINFNTPASP